jgi:hypothetical protein
VEFNSEKEVAMSNSHAHTIAHPTGVVVPLPEDFAYDLNTVHIPLPEGAIVPRQLAGLGRLARRYCEGAALQFDSPRRLTATVPRSRAPAFAHALAALHLEIEAELPTEDDTEALSFRAPNARLTARQLLSLAALAQLENATSISLDRHNTIRIHGVSLARHNIIATELVDSGLKLS